MNLVRHHPRTRPIGVGHLRAFEAVARHLNFRVAAEELSLTQSAVSRQIQGLEDEVGAALFLRHTRAVELTSAGAMLLGAVGSTLERLDSTVRQIRQTAGRKSVAITTWASFASMWLIPRLEAFQRDHPDIDIRIDATDNAVDLSTADVDLALRYAVPQGMATGTRVEIQGDMVNGRLQARRVELDDDNDSDDSNTDPNELEGRVTAYSGPTRFSVDGIPVNASAVPTSLAVGMRVEVYGTMTNGTMVASRVKVENQSGSDDNADDSNDANDDSDSGNDDLCDAVGKSACEDDGKD